MTAKAKSAARGKGNVAAPNGVRPRRRNKSRKRWQAILEAATELFNKHGFYAASMQDISEKVGIGKGSLYYYVDSKEDILFEILRDLHHGGEALVESTNFKSTDPLGELRALLVQMGTYAGKHADRLEIFARDFDYLHPEQQRMILSERRLYWDAVVKLIALSIERGQVSQSLDIRTAAQIILRAVSSISQWYRQSGTLQIEQVAVQTAILMVQGLANYDRR